MIHKLKNVYLLFLLATSVCLSFQSASFRLKGLSFPNGRAGLPRWEHPNFPPDAPPRPARPWTATLRHPRPAAPPRPRTGDLASALRLAASAPPSSARGCNYRMHPTTAGLCSSLLPPPPPPSPTTRRAILARERERSADPPAPPWTAFALPFFFFSPIFFLFSISVAAQRVLARPVIFSSLGRMILNVAL